MFYYSMQTYNCDNQPNQMESTPPGPITTYQLYDRMVQIQGNYSMPLGYSGTVIAVQTCSGSFSLDSSDNSYRMSKLSINQSYELSQYKMKTGKPGNLHQSNAVQPRQSGYRKYHQQNSTFATWGMQQNQGMQNSFPLQNYNFQPPVNLQQQPIMYDNFCQYQSNNPDPTMFPLLPQNVSQMNMDGFMPNFGQEQNLQYIEQKNDVGRETYTKLLMDYYQLQGYGCPRFTYFDSPDGKLFQAQVDIPFSTEGIMGLPATNWELACDIAAKFLLEKLQNHNATKVTFEHQMEVAGTSFSMPKPPRQWSAPKNYRSNKNRRKSYPPQNFRQRGNPNSRSDFGQKENAPMLSTTLFPINFPMPPKEWREPEYSPTNQECRKPESQNTENVDLVESKLMDYTTFVSQIEEGIKSLTLQNSERNERDTYMKQLMDYCQVQGYGCPRFTYFDAPRDRLFQAQIDLPVSKDAVIGLPATSWELACDNAAQILLNKLSRNNATDEDQLGGTSAPMTFPVPPKQWNAPEDDNGQIIQNDDLAGNEKREPHAGPEYTTAIPFIPLQVMMHSRRTNAAETQNENLSTVNNAIENKVNDCKVQEQAIITKVENLTETRRNIRRRERKVRIAANFKIAPSTS